MKTRNLLIVLAICVFGYAGLSLAASQGVAGLQSDITTDFADSSNITAAELRGVTTDITDSFLNLTDGGTVAGNVTLDDNSGASPNFTMTDATNETAVFSKVDSGFLTVTTVAADGIGVLVGNLKVGNGTPGTAQDGEDAYVEGTFEVDGASRFDGAVSLNSTIASAYAASADSGTTNNAINLPLTFPIDTTGTNTHTLVNMALTAADATGGTNTVNGLNFANYTGDAQVNVNAINIGTSDGLGTAKAIVVGSGWDSGITNGSVSNLNGDVVGDGGDQMYGFLHEQVASTTTSATIAQCGATFVSDSADVLTLPEASTALGCRYTFVCGTADDFDINPADGTDQILSVSTTNGTTGVVTLAPSAGDAIRCTDIGGSITLEATGANAWAQVGGGNGIWTDVN